MGGGRTQVSGFMALGLRVQGGEMFRDFRAWVVELRLRSMLHTAEAENLKH